MPGPMDNHCDPGWGRLQENYLIEAMKMYRRDHSNALVSVPISWNGHGKYSNLPKRNSLPRQESFSYVPPVSGYLVVG